MRLKSRSKRVLVQLSLGQKDVKMRLKTRKTLKPYGWTSSQHLHRQVSRGYPESWSNTARMRKKRKIYDVIVINLSFEILFIVVSVMSSCVLHWTQTQSSRVRVHAFNHILQTVKQPSKYKVL